MTRLPFLSVLVLCVFSKTNKRNKTEKRKSQAQWGRFALDTADGTVFHFSTQGADGTRCWVENWKRQANGWSSGSSGADSILEISGTGHCGPRGSFDCGGGFAPCTTS